MEDNRIDLHKVPEAPFESRRYLLGPILDSVAKQSSTFLAERLSNRQLLKQAIVFFEQDLLDVQRSDFESLGRTGFVPVVEAAQALDESLTHALFGYHKASVDSQRRALEITLVGAYFTSSAVTAADARKWMQAMCQTPFFTRALAALGKISPYREANDSCGWSDLLRQHYFDLCDIVHVRGEPASYRELQPSPFVFGGCHTPGFSEDRLARTADSLLRTIQHIAAIDKRPKFIPHRSLFLDSIDLKIDCMFVGFCCSAVHSHVIETIAHSLHRINLPVEYVTVGYLSNPISRQR